MNVPNNIETIDPHVLTVTYVPPININRLPDRVTQLPPPLKKIRVQVHFIATFVTPPENKKPEPCPLGIEFLPKKWKPWI